ncbi:MULTISPECIES: hypothetical protein [Heyndrickxia]|uniref:hypothetical protein n=1 Tax=Heyndrickxia TaxID=2837504 RepID=UPI002E1BB61B|nr:hypothetical protein [Weizmannia sp. CD-2023]
MALQMDFTIPETGLTIHNAYIRIKYTTVSFDIQTVTLAIYVSKESESYNAPVYECVYSFQNPDLSDNGKNPYKQGYDFIKTKDEFKDAIDVLDPGQIA